MIQINSWRTFLGLAFGLFCLYVIFPPTFLLLAAVFAFIFGTIALQSEPHVSPAQSLPSYRSPAQPARPAATARVELPRSAMPENLPADLKCPSCGASLKPNARKCEYCGSTLKPAVDLPEPAKLAQLEVGMTVRLAVPQKGDQVYRIKGRLLFTELWQASSGPNVPWTPTGNYFAGFALEPAAYLLNWQARFYILEERRALTDMDINRDFAPAARRFAQSNQTVVVNFSYNGANWKMVDIGRFAIEFEEGEGNHLHMGAIGRFIHSSSGNRALVVDDFQSGGSGGQDVAWLGFQVAETDIHF